MAEGLMSTRVDSCVLGEQGGTEGQAAELQYVRRLSSGRTGVFERF